MSEDLLKIIKVMCPNAVTAICVMADEARRLRHSPCDTGELLVGVSLTKTWTAAQVLKEQRVTIKTLRAALEAERGRGTDAVRAEVPMSDLCMAALHAAYDEAMAGDGRIHTANILSALVTQDSGTAIVMLRKLDVDLDKLKQRLKELPGDSGH